MVTFVTFGRSQTLSSSWEAGGGPPSYFEKKMFSWKKELGA
jgi:hypothetical protein